MSVLDWLAVVGGICLICSVGFVWACCRVAHDADRSTDEIERQLAECGWIAPPVLNAPVHSVSLAQEAQRNHG